MSFLKYCESGKAFNQAILPPLHPALKDGQCYGLAFTWYVFRKDHPKVNFIDILTSAAIKQRGQVGFFAKTLTPLERRALQLASVFQESQELEKNVKSLLVEDTKPISEDEISAAFKENSDAHYAYTCKFIDCESEYAGFIIQEMSIKEFEEFVKSIKADSFLTLALGRDDDFLHEAALAYDKASGCYYFFDANFGEFKIKSEKLAKFLHAYLTEKDYDIAVINSIKPKPEPESVLSKASSISTAAAAKAIH